MSVNKIHLVFTPDEKRPINRLLLFTSKFAKVFLEDTIQTGKKLCSQDFMNFVEQIRDRK